MPQRNELRLDRVVASQPELGPSVPDGGYGWLILVASLFLQTQKHADVGVESSTCYAYAAYPQVLLPSILASYGIFMLFSRLENSAYSDEPKLWDTDLLPTPIVFMAVWCLADPWSRTIVVSSTWPRLVTTSGIFLTCGGLLIQWVAMRDLFGVPFYMLAGALTGFGACLAMTQSEVLISQYFRLKLLTVTNIMICVYSLGFIIIPIMLGFMIFHKGILHSLLIYQAIILQCVIITSVFKKPLYLKAARRRYELLQNTSEDDEMIFAKDEIVQNNATEASSSNSNQSNNQSDQQRKRSLLINTFNSENSQESAQVPENNDPQPIFSEVEIVAQTNTYSFDNNIAVVNEDNVTIITQDRIPRTSWKEEMGFLIKLPFYKSLFFLTTVKYSALMFWILFPTYLFVEMDKLQLQQTTFIVGAMGLGSLLIGFFLFVFPMFGRNKQILTASFCFLSSVGYFILSDAGTEGWMLFGAILITTSITALHSLHPSVIKFILKDDNDKAHTLLHTLVGICIMFFLVQDITYKNCFRIMSTMQLFAGFLLIFGLLISYFKKICSR